MTDFLELLIWNLWPFGPVNLVSYAVLIAVCAAVAYICVKVEDRKEARP